MLEQQEPTVYVNPYKFNAKELDEDTGLYYYGARYYNPRLSIWYGVDPLAEKMPSWSPYNYTFDNPIKYVDPDGKSPVDIIFNLYDVSSGKYKEYARIKSEKYNMSVNISAPYPFHGISLAPDTSQRRTYGNYRGISGKYKFDELASLHGDPDALSIGLGGNISGGAGFGLSASVALMLKGPDAGKAGLYGTANNLEGFEASAGIQASLMFSDISLKEFRLNTLEGYAEGVQGGGGPVGVSMFKSYDGEYKSKGGWFSGKTFQKKSLLYHGYSYGLGVGPEDVSASVSAFSGDTKYLGEVTNIIKSK
ncbi:RHS repeat-associated core domain-containing protein [Chryseobacterium sp. Leaf201]|uniref:RHS repeat-associated core domain-containing protein n=1 Tax=Chryseobacterium sp. Leaf201 TaxID=1735672 RepID=UPI0006F584AE|nr:RHS repeat-associated core domain-containing protein [Chryseobacterium sp. Leaf201]KQM56832.1 hypothetical protein ASE55_19400 [Chryseobacterium sp. Leaf201]